MNSHADTPQPNLHSIRFLATAAVGHAWQDYQCDLTRPESLRDALAAVDRILDSEIQRPDPQQLDALVDCYGAWFGMQLCQLDSIRWTHLAAAVSPRLIVAGRPVAPFDAVRRRLTDPQALTLVALLQRAQQWLDEHDQAALSEQQVLRRNCAAWDTMVDHPRFSGSEAVPTDRASALEALDPWIAQEGINGRRLLCLAAGGARQGPLHALAGAVVTVVDISEKQLSLDRDWATACGHNLETICSSITDLSALPEACFDIVLQPVSTCYVSDVAAVYQQVARVTKPGGLYVVQHKQPLALHSRWDGRRYEIQRGEIESAVLSDPSSSVPAWLHEAGTIEFAHTRAQLIGGLCAAGFHIEGYDEPLHGDAWAAEGSPTHHSFFTSPYLKIKARRQPLLY